LARNICRVLEGIDLTLPLLKFRIAQLHFKQNSNPNLKKGRVGSIPPKLCICYAPKKPPVQKIWKIQKFWRVTYAEFWTAEDHHRLLVKFSETHKSEFILVFTSCGKSSCNPP
jgi:hypothetical protein